MGQSGAHTWELPFTMRKEGLHLQLRGGKAVPVSIPMMYDRPVKVLYVAPPLALTTPPSTKATAPLPPAQRSHKSPGVLASVLVCELSHVNKVDTVWVSSRSRGPKGYPAVSIPSVSPSPPPPPAQRPFPQRAPRERAVAGSARRSRNPRTIAASLCRRTAARP